MGTACRTSGRTSAYGRERSAIVPTNTAAVVAQALR